MLSIWNTYKYPLDRVVKIQLGLEVEDKIYSVYSKKTTKNITSMGGPH